MTRWARAVAGDPNATTQADVDELRSAGFSDADIFAMTAFVGLRIAFSTVNDARRGPTGWGAAGFLAARGDAAVDFGRPIAHDDAP